MIHTPTDTGTFRKMILDYYSRNRRCLPWRNTGNPYEILISEIMLQQTQVERVLSKYEVFLKRFPDFTALAGADLQAVLALWVGLGYNRRAIALKKIAEVIVEDHAGILPDTLEGLVSLPGIGRATAGAILAFAYNKPVTFIETNIRRVFIHSFFKGKDKVRDSEIFPLIEKTLDRRNPREWYYALMDYGSMLKSTVANPNRKSAHYSRQSCFEGSDRQIRGNILKMLVSAGDKEEGLLASEIGYEPERTRKIIVELIREGFIRRKHCLISIV